MCCNWERKPHAFEHFSLRLTYPKDNLKNIYLPIIAAINMVLVWARQYIDLGLGGL